jgi:hypothetical protein
MKGKNKTVYKSRLRECDYWVRMAASGVSYVRQGRAASTNDVRLQIAGATCGQTSFDGGS